MTRIVHSDTGAHLPANKIAEFGIVKNTSNVVMLMDNGKEHFRRFNTDDEALTFLQEVADAVTAGPVPLIMTFPDGSAYRTSIIRSIEIDTVSDANNPTTHAVFVTMDDTILRYYCLCEEIAVEIRKRFVVAWRTASAVRDVEMVPDARTGHDLPYWRIKPI